MDKEKNKNNKFNIGSPFSSSVSSLIFSFSKSLFVPLIKKSRFLALKNPQSIFRQEITESEAAPLSEIGELVDEQVEKSRAASVEQPKVVNPKSTPTNVVSLESSTFITPLNPMPSKTKSSKEAASIFLSEGKRPLIPPFPSFGELLVEQPSVVNPIPLLTPVPNPFSPPLKGGGKNGVLVPFRVKGKQRNEAASFPLSSFNPRPLPPLAPPEGGVKRGKMREKGGKEIGQKSNRQDIVSITYEEIGFFPRSFSRVLDRFLKQVFSDVENLVIQEYRFYRYLFLTTLKCVLILFFVPFIVNYFSKTYLVSPLTEYFWNTQQTEIFLNSYQQKRAFTELKDFEEKLYFESLINCDSKMCRFHDIDSNSIIDRPSYLTNNPASNSSIKVEKQDFVPKEELEENGKKAIALPSSILELNKNEEYPNKEKPITPSLFCETTLPPLVAKHGVNNQRLFHTQFSKRGLNNQVPWLFSNGVLVPFRVNGVPPLPPLGGMGTGVSEFIRQTSTRQDAFEQRLQEKTIELAIRYNNQSIEAITNFFADLLSFLTLCYLLIILEIQINITKSFLLEVFFGLDDGKKSLFILLITDLLVGYHSSNLWELFFEFLFNHYGLPESQTGIFLLVATLPVLLDVLFKYLIFRHLNRSSPATVATYHAIIE